MNQKHVVIVGGGFAGMSCARKLVDHQDVRVTLIDKNNYSEFKPLLYQVATSALATEDIATTFRQFFKGKRNLDIKMAEAIAIDPHTRTVQTKEGESYQGDILVLAAGSVVNFFNTANAVQYTFPLYTLPDAEKLRSRIIAVFEDADRNPNLIDQGALNFVIVGAGATGTEVAGALADMFKQALPDEFLDLAVKKATIYLVDGGHAVLGAFSEESQRYAANILQKRGVQLVLGRLVKEVAPDHVILSDGSRILTRTIIWAGGLKAASLAQQCGLPTGHGGRIDVQPDLTVAGFSSIYALGDFANIKGPDGKFFPQLASVAQQCGYWTAKNILAEIEGKAREPFQYNDKGIMAMIGRNAAIAEIGEKRRQFQGIPAFFTWLLVHAVFLPSMRQRMISLFSWSWNYFGKTNALQVLDNADAANIKWNDNRK
jgi:NADH:ubiquinone reductase (H+-translocating)